MWWMTKKLSCMAKDSPNPTEVPTRISPAFDPIIVFERASAVLLRQSTVATDATAAATHNKRPAPNQTPWRPLGLSGAGILA
jgi:hypothetical protein